MPTIEIRVDVSWMPHSFIIIDNGAGFVQGYGFAPAAANDPTGPGHIYPDTEHPYDFSTGSIQITNDQYNSIANKINGDIQNPPYYNLPGSVVFPGTVQQCAQWAMDVARHGNVSLPFTMHRGGWNPYGQAIWIGVDKAINGIEQLLNDLYLRSRTWTPPPPPPRRDPLTLDLDGDGIETTGVTGTVLFDHNCDGIRTGSGWVGADDGLLVLDRNGNGQIDNGAELFGADTVLANGQKASDGFAALRDLDGNGDNVFDAQDARFADVRVWRDLAQNGVSQNGELFTLETLGITAINLNAANETVDLGNGNLQTASATYVRANGTTGEAAGVALGETTANLELAQNPFYRQFTDTIALTGESGLLPQMQGSGMVRDLREAASLSPELTAAASAYAAQTTRAGQMALLDGLITAWAGTAGMEAANEAVFAMGRAA